MTITVGYLAQNGTLIAATGDNTAAALGKLTDQFGDDVQLLYTEAHKELVERINRVVEEYDPHGGSVDGTDSGSVGGDRSGGPDGRTGVPDSVQGGEPGEDVGGGSREREDQNGSGAQGERGERQEGQEVCAVCEGAVKPARAETALEEYGEVRCKRCSG